jgi:anti-sigma-K factor RskA
MSATIPEAIRELAAGYALGALTPEETREFEAAMARSSELRAEVEEYRELNAALSSRPGPTPAPELRQRLLDRVASNKVVPIQKARSRWTPLLGLAFAASTVLAAGLGIRLGDLSRRLEAKDAELESAEAKLLKREQTLNTILMGEADLSVVRLTATGATAPGVQFFWNKRSNTAVVHAFRLPPTEKGKVYQLWVLRDGKPIPGPTFQSGADGHALVQTFALPSGGGFSAAAVTVEPEGGSKVPTMPIILFGQVSGG